ncbi:MAG: UvrD-helicase domain-containing protein [Kiritimatiellae bacterium]|nr:UvrD-helicase domain-containing protein [Kiritimatiellia bacterium]
MAFYADLHIHSKYSRATSRDCDLEHLAFWAARKGISVIGTGDFTHPAWFGEIQEKLVPAEPGLFCLRADLQRAVERELGVLLQDPTRFALQVEISTIYKKHDKTRKVHHVVFVPDLEQADRFRQSLGRIGNITSDGRPILGLDSRDLLEITLECGDGAFLIPAHIWTPWFSPLGSKSGFDDIAHCYADLTEHIFAVETGLSSDPPMNWRLSRLDAYRLVSNSDAHSPGKLGREACVFESAMDYFAMRDALRTGEGYGGTVEFFPEEGKYHMDGHRKCGVCLDPAETRKHNGLCPVCGKALTVGVMSRVDALADRPEGRPPPGAARFRSLIPLCEILAEIRQVGAGSKGVRQAYDDLLSRLGTELFILEHAPADELERAGGAMLAEAVLRMREGRVIRQPGFDGEYGVIRLFTPDEIAQGAAVGLLFDMPQPAYPENVRSKAMKAADSPAAGPGWPGEDARPTGAERDPHAESRVIRDASAPAPAPGSAKPQSPIVNRSLEARGAKWDRQSSSPHTTPLLAGLDSDQAAAARIIRGPLLIVAGPGTGKTRTLTHRIAHLVADHHVAPDQCLAITFTRRAAGEMQERLHDLLPETADRIPVTTFHALGLGILREQEPRLSLPRPFQVADPRRQLELLATALALSEPKARRALSAISRLKRAGNTAEPGSETAGILDRYQAELRAACLLDFDDLIGLSVHLLEADPALADRYRAAFPWVSVDEYQDVDERQYRLVRLLVPPDGNLCAIGDPDQAIYGFRGTDVRFFQRFETDFPGARVVQLTRNYRSGRGIVDGALQAVAPSSLVAGRTLEARLADTGKIVIRHAPTDRAEAEFVVHTVERMIGGSTFFSLDSGRVEACEGDELSFADFAVLYRTDAQAGLLVEAFARSGIPFQKRSHNRLGDTPVVQAILTALRDAPPAGPLEKRIRRLSETLEGDAAPGDIVRAADALTGLAARCDGDLNRFLAELALGTDVDLWDPRADAVSLLTLHAAKGLEFRVVFVVGCEDGILPLHWGPADEADATDIAEERRLFFVGMTRARDRLFLSHANRRAWRGPPREMTPSPFLLDIEERLLDRQRAEYRKKTEQPPAARQLDLFATD